MIRLIIADPDPDFLPIPDLGIKKTPDPESGSAPTGTKMYAQLHITKCYVHTYRTYFLGKKLKNLVKLTSPRSKENAVVSENNKKDTVH
jgi:hypothetical protein